MQPETSSAEKEARTAAEKAGAGGGGAVAELEEEGGELHEGGDGHSPARFHDLVREG